MAIDLTETFEGGTNGAALTTGNTGFGLIGGTAPTFTTTGVHLGALAMQASASAATSYGQHTLGAARAISFLRWYLTFQAAPAATTYICNAMATATIRAQVRVNTARTLSMRNSTTAVWTSTTTLATGTLYRIEWDLNNTAGTQRLRIFTGDSVTAVEDSGAQTYNAGTHDRFLLGIPSAATWTWQADDLQIRDDFTPGPMGKSPPILRRPHRGLTMRGRH